MENKTHAGNYKGTTSMNAENQDMAFVNDTLEKQLSEPLNELIEEENEAKEE